MKTLNTNSPNDKADPQTGTASVIKEETMNKPEDIKTETLTAVGSSAWFGKILSNPLLGRKTHTKDTTYEVSLTVPFSVAQKLMKSELSESFPCLDGYPHSVKRIR